MNRFLSCMVLVLAVAVVLGLAGSVQAAEATGKIKSVSADNNRFVLTDKDGKDWTFQMAEDGKIQLNDKDSKIGDLKRGFVVEVTYDKKGDKLIATQVKAKSE